MKGGGRLSGYAELDREHLSIVIQYSPICAYRYAFLSIAMSPQRRGFESHCNYMIFIV